MAIRRLYDAKDDGGYVILFEDEGTNRACLVQTGALYEMNEASARSLAQALTDWADRNGG